MKLLDILRLRGAEISRLIDFGYLPMKKQKVPAAFEER